MTTLHGCVGLHGNEVVGESCDACPSLMLGIVHKLQTCNNEGSYVDSGSNAADVM